MSKILQTIIAVFVVASAVLYVGWFRADAPIQAGEEHNTSGFAWSNMERNDIGDEHDPTIGWISFNSTNCDSDGDGVTDMGNFAQCPTGLAISDYGVRIDPDTGDLSGHAYYDADDPNTVVHEGNGWISFNRSDTGNPPEAPFKGGNDPIAKVDIETGELTGWMRVLACCDSVPCLSSDPCLNCGGWDGWIRFCDDTMDSCSGDNQIAKIDADGDWHGWAWSSEVVGWISFNSAEGGGSAYKVTSVLNNPPTANFLSDILSADYCGGDTPNNIFLEWQFNDTDPSDNQTAYEVEVTRINDSITRTTGKQSSTVSSVSVFTINNFIGSQFIWYDPSELGYTWKVKVWDSKDAESPWSSSNSFNTTKHQHLSVDFSWPSQELRVEKDVQFTDGSTCYDTDGVCDNWSWTIPNANYIDGTLSSSQNPVVQFTATGQQEITLTITDSDGYICSKSKTVEIQWKLPSWEEIAP
ncbi:MAG: PKD domain-containing protein [Patescibacteria group bacterium]|nr:PKD domain-containing protein [Patescibacteria group bacterium]